MIISAAVLRRRIVRSRLKRRGLLIDRSSIRVNVRAEVVGATTAVRLRHFRNRVILCRISLLRGGQGV